MSRILVVAEDPLLADGLAAVLGAAGHQVVGVATNSSSALQLAGEGGPELVLIDVTLSGVSDGIGTAVKIQAERPVSIIFISAHHDPQPWERAAAVQPALFLSEPFSARELLAAVTAAAEQVTWTREVPNLDHTLRTC
jgi:two-component system, response regulator PdtaR